MSSGPPIRRTTMTKETLMPVNLEPATRRLAALVACVPDDALVDPTPCDIAVGALLDHVATLAVAFTAAARKDGAGPTGPPPPPDVANLGPEWRDTIPRALDELAIAWSEADAWSGTTRVGGMDMPGEAAGLVALDEVVMHGWDLARALDLPYDVDQEHLEALMGFLVHMAEPDMTAAREGLFGPVVTVAADAPLLARALGLAGRDPAWRGSGSPGPRQ
jgi:uncharacterized protein (TIGR03086 family)